MANRTHVAALIAIVALGVAVRLGFLSRPIQYDEAYTFNEYASKPWLDEISTYTFPNNHLLNTLLVHEAAKWFGPWPWAIRSPAFVAGVLLIPATYGLVAALCGRGAGLFAAALVAASAPAVDYSTNARGYSLVALAAVVLLILARRIASGGGRWAEWAAFGLVAALGLFAIPVMLYPWLGAVLWLLLGRVTGYGRARTGRLLVSVVGTSALAVLFYLPAAFGSGLKALVANPFVAPRPLDEVVRTLPASLAMAWWQWNGDYPLAVPALGVIACGVSLGACLLGRGGCCRIWGMTLVVLAASLALALAQRVAPPERVWLFALPLYSGCVGSGVAWLVGRLVRRPDGVAWVSAALAVGVALVLGLLVARGDALPRETRETTLMHAAAIARQLKQALRPEDGVVAFVPCDAPLKYHMRREGVPVEALHDYRVGRARRLFVAVGRSAGQTLEGVLDASRISRRRGASAILVRQYGDSALYALER